MAHSEEDQSEESETREQSEVGGAQEHDEVGGAQEQSEVGGAQEQDEVGGAQGQSTSHQVWSSARPHAQATLEAWAEVSGRLWGHVHFVYGGVRVQLMRCPSNREEWDGSCYKALLVSGIMASRRAFATWP